MESWFCWIHLVILFRTIWASSTQYTIHQAQVSFDRAAEDCYPGVLTTIATELEVADILGLISQSTSPNQKEFTFWIGLRKVKNQCVVPTLPLRGFKWTEDGSEDSQVSRWTEEPKYTCTSVRCAALKGEWDGSKVTRWGLIPVTCKNSYQFICKMRDIAAPEPPTPAAPEPPKPTAPEPPKPAKPEPIPATQKTEPANPEPGLPFPGLKPETDLKPENGPELKGPDPNPGSDSCQHPVIISARSISFHNSSRIQVECWSRDQVELRCSGHPAVWRLLDNSPASFTTVCLPCGNGFRKDISGNCVDVDECGGSSLPCRHICLNMEGSYRCFCSDENGKHHNEDSPACADKTTSVILIPVLAAVAALVVLLLFVAVTVKCCLMRQSKKPARKEAEKMAMKSNDGRDSFETANEKAP
ncbi:C-type lectin domain family 14 member A [Cyclopterus lumpus]|uniref:C-type lectin domain family 14 member A n=1 Tax=Cyclopterus lumpus TaxID=8103 RepID=UPI001486A919|nr:C-type lectin domain family 14 member A [Cyclopterus lumpus]